MTEAVWGWGEKRGSKGYSAASGHHFLSDYDCAVMSRMGGELGMEADADFFDERCGELQKAINEEYYREEGFYGTGAQGADVMPLFLGIVPEGEKEPGNAPSADWTLLRKKRKPSGYRQSDDETHL